MSRSECPDKKKARLGAGDQENTQHSNGSSSRAQQQRILGDLRHGPVTTFKARTELDVAHPAARVQELREQGFNIVTFWSTELSDAGTPHRVAKYVLFGEPRQGVLL